MSVPSEFTTRKADLMPQIKRRKRAGRSKSKGLKMNRIKSVFELRSKCIRVRGESTKLNI